MSGDGKFERCPECGKLRLQGQKCAYDKEHKEGQKVKPR
jgi:hypothetical protein